MFANNIPANVMEVEYQNDIHENVCVMPVSMFICPLLLTENNLQVHLKKNAKKTFPSNLTFYTLGIGQM